MNMYGAQDQYDDPEGSNEDQGSEDNSQDDGGDGNKQGGKRRSKNDNAGRDFKCKYCDKTYLSYPALYTHMKQKHSKGPDGELRNPPTSGRGRGRPRKNPYQRLDPRTEDFFKAPEREGGPVDPLACFSEIYTQIFSYQQALPPQKIQLNMYEYPIYKHLVQFSHMVDSNGQLKAGEQAPLGTPEPQNQTEEGKANDNVVSQQLAENARNENQETAQVNQDQQAEGGEAESNYEGGEDDDHGQPKAPENQTGFNQTAPNGAQFPPQGVYNGAANGQQYQQQPPVQQNGVPSMQPVGNPLPQSVPQTSAPVAANLSTLPPSANPQKWQRNYDNLTDKDRNEMLVDEIFALYLYRMSNRINQMYYKTVLAYVIFFRECLNEYGWGKKIESEGIRLENNPVLKLDIETKQFCLVNNAEHAPEICNEFVTVYMEYKKNIFDIPKHDQIDLTINLCHWLFECQFTCSKLTMIA